MQFVYWSWMQHREYRKTKRRFFIFLEELESGKGNNISYVRGGETGKRSNVIRQAIVTAGEGGRGGGNP